MTGKVAIGRRSRLERRLQGRIAHPTIMLTNFSAFAVLRILMV
jgi:hypothetical protein